MKSENTNPEFLSPSETARYLNITLPYLYKLNHLKRIKYYKPFGKKVLYKLSDIINFIESKPIHTESEIESKANQYVNQ